MHLVTLDINLGILKALISAGITCDLLRLNNESNPAEVLARYVLEKSRAGILVDSVACPWWHAIPASLLQCNDGQAAVPIIAISEHINLPVELAHAMHFAKHGGTHILQKALGDEVIAALVYSTLDLHDGKTETPKEYIFPFEHGSITVDLLGRRILVNEKLVIITPQEWSVVAFLAKRQGTVVSKEAIMKHLYGNTMTRPPIKNLDVVMSSIRRKMASAIGDFKFITTIWGEGWMIERPQP